MTLLMFDGFDSYKTSAGSSDMNLNGWSAAGNVATTTPSTRLGRGKWGGGVGNNQYSLTTTYTTLLAGVAIYPTAAGAQLLAFVDGSANQHLTVMLNTTTRYIEVRRGIASGTIIATGTTVIPLNQWFYLEIKAKIDDSTGTIQVRLNGSSTDEINLSSLDTRNGGNANIQVIILGGSNGSFDDLYVLDPTTGSSPYTDFLGDVEVQTVYPTSDDSVQFTPSTGSNWQNVDDAGSDGDSTYNSSSTANQKDLFVMGDLTGTPVVFGAYVQVWSRKDDSGTRGIKTHLKAGSTDDAGSDTALTTSYAMYTKLYITDPDTTVQWLYGGINSVKAGYEVT